MGNEGRVAPPSSLFFICCFTGAFVIGKCNSSRGVVVDFQPVQQRNSNMTSKWPFEVVVKLSSHQVGKYRDMCGLAITAAISIHTETHLIALWVGVEW